MSDEPEVIDVSPCEQNTDADGTTELAVRPPEVQLAVPGRRAVFQPHPDTPIDIWTSEVDCVRCTPRMVMELIDAHVNVKDAIRFLLVCRQAGLNPFGKEVHISRNVDDRGKIVTSFIVAQQAIRRISQQHPKYLGMTFDYSPKIVDKFVPPVVGICKVWRKDAPEPYVQEVFYEQAITRGGKKISKGYAIDQPHEFLRGVCEARALRHAFSDKFSPGVYAEGEF